MNTLTTPKLSIGLPVYNGGRFLQQTLESIVGQSFHDIEIIISDNCSTDRTPQICNEFVARDRRIRYHRNATNIGGPANYNAVFELSRGDLFKWASASDVCGPDLFAKCIAKLDADRTAVLAFPRTRLFETDIRDYTDYDDRMNLTQRSAYERLNTLLESLRLNNVMNGVIRRSALLQTKLHRGFLSSDEVLLAELALRGPFVVVDDTYYYRRMTPETTVNLRSKDGIMHFWAPGRHSPLRFQRWRYLIALAGAVFRARAGVKETLLATMTVLQRFRWARSELFAELFAAGQSPSRPRAP